MTQPSTREIVYECIVNLANMSKPASRLKISQMTGLKLSLVDDHIKNLKNDDKIECVVAGVFAPKYMSASRPVSATIANPHEVIIEVGDFVGKMNFHEASLLGALLSGMAMVYKKP